MTDRERLDEDDPTPGIELGRDGDPLPQGTRMIEIESYERVIEGLKIASDACMHLAKRELTQEGVANRRGLALKLDQCRRMCIQKAGIEDVVRSSPTQEMRGEPLPFKKARNRLVNGLAQASGGARQLATCFRLDLTWASVAQQLEKLERNIRNPKRMRHQHPLLLPTGYTRH
jgi:hypothetical protein